ncbi:MAG TPA: PEP-CTERM sorting domain-containing protein [Thermoguttaceae bacterium]
MKNKIIKKIPGLLILCGCCILALSLHTQPVQADIINGGFENGFDSWEFFYYGFGSYNAGANIYNDPLSPEGYYYAHLENVVLTYTNYDHPYDHGWSSTSMRQSFYAFAGDQLLLKYRLWRGIFESGSEPEYSWYSFDAGFSVGDSYFSPSLTSEWEELSFPVFQSNGYYTIYMSTSVEVINVLDNPPQTSDIVEAHAFIHLEIDDIRLVPIPEPSSIIYLSAAAISLLAYVWRRRRKQAA